MKRLVMIAAKRVYQWCRHHFVFLVPLALLEREFLELAKETFTLEQ